MADYCCEYTIAGLTINDESADSLITDFESGEITGLDGAPIRAQIDPKGVTHGGIVFPKWYGPRIITFKGSVNIQSVDADDRDNYLGAVNTVEAAVISALEGILNTPSSLSWTPTGGSGKSISVTYGTEGGEIQFSGNMLERKFTFTLVAENPAIS